MRIGVIFDGPYTSDPRVKNEALSLIKQGHEIFLFSLSYGDEPREEILDGIKIVRYQTNKLEYRLSAVAYDLPFYHQFMAKKIGQFLSAYPIEILHIHDMVIAQAVFMANRPHGLPVVLDLHENRPAIMQDYKHVNRIPGKWLIHLRQWQRKYYELAALADRVVVVTELAKADILDHVHRAPGDICPVPNTPLLSAFTTHPQSADVRMRLAGHFNVVYMGDTSIRRGTDTAIIAASILIEKIPNLVLWLIGRSSADRDLKRLTLKLGMSSSVRFEGWQDMSLFPTYFSNSHVCLSPLKRNLHHDTTFANKLFLYMAAGTALVVSDCTAQAQLVLDEKCGLVHQADDPEALAEKIFSLYKNPALNEQLGENGRSAVTERWNWEKTTRPFQEMYRELENQYAPSSIRN